MNLKIMAVDDEPHILELIKAFVGPLGMEVATSIDSQEAMQRINSEVFDGFLLDARMPNLDGFELARCIRKSPINGSVPVAMLTGSDDVETMRLGFKAGVTFFLGKPFTRERAAGLFSAMRGAILRDKRRHARLPYRTAVGCSVGEPAERTFSAESVNVGEGGMLVESSAEVETGQVLRLEFSMPNRKKPLRPLAKILRQEPHGRFALQFTAIEHDETEAIRDYIFGRPEE
jgi:CheY-like chemotaxis protein